MIETTEVVERIDQPQDLKEEMIETTEVVERIDQPQDLKEEIKIQEVMGLTKEVKNLMILKRNLMERKNLLKKMVLEKKEVVFQVDDKILEINFDQ
jgi:hypothetical protein